MIRLTDATVTFASVAETSRTALSSVTFSVAAREWVAVVGSNASGKTTFLRAIAGLVPFDSGSLQFESESEPRIAMLLQEPDNQFVTSSVFNELIISMPEGLSAPEREERVEAALDAYSLHGLAGRNPHRLSGGEKQRLALATVWLQRPDVVLLDEPVAYLDPEMAALCIDFVTEMNQNGAAVLWATLGGDDLNLAQRIVFLREGRVEFDGEREMFFGWARKESVDFEPPSIRSLADGITERVGIEFDAEAASNVESLALALVKAGARSPASEALAPVQRSVPAAIRFEDVSFAYGDRAVFDGLNVEIRRCTGVTGANASGKTTLLLLAAGALEPTAGRVVRRESEDGLARRVVYVPQSPERMFFAETVAQELAFGPKQIGIDPATTKRRSLEALLAVGFDETMLQRAPLELSAGEMRRVAFAVTLALDPHFVLFDEPTAGLDSEGRRVFLDVVRECRDSGATVAIASHDTSMLCEACDRVVFLDQGRVDVEIDTTGGELPDGSVWPPGNIPLILELQDELLRKHGVDVRPRALTTSRFASRVGTLPRN